MRRILLWPAALVVAVAVLIVTDRALRRATQLDQLILQGQTGFDWFDSYLTRRAQARAALKELRAAVAGATGLAQRLQAHYALYDFEVRRGGGRRARAALRAIATEGQAHPLTVRAWREWLQTAVAAREHKEVVRSLADSYVAAIQNLPPSQEQWSGLVEVWRIAEQHRWADLELTALERLHRDYPRATGAEPAYQALAARYRQSRQTDRLPAVEESLREIRKLVLRQADEQTLAKQLQQQLTAKQLAEAETTFFSLTPGLVPANDYRGLLRKLLACYDAPEQLPAALRAVAFAADQSPPAQTHLEELAALRLTQGALQLENGQLAESRATLEKAPAYTTLDAWREHLLARLELLEDHRPQTLHTVEAVRGRSEQAWVQLPGPPPWRWRAWYDDQRLRFEIQAHEPNRSGIVATHTTRDSDVWSDDGVELFFAPRHSDAAYFQVAINTRGVLTDVRHARRMGLIPFNYAADRGWTSDAAIDAGWLTDGWWLKVSIPWQERLLSPPDAACFFNVRRLRHVTGKPEAFDWSPGNEPDRRPAAFGVLMFQP